MTFTRELEEIITTTVPAAGHPTGDLTANERMLRELAFRLLALKHGGTWNDTPVVGYDGR
jgi:hypothetical protein